MLSVGGAALTHGYCLPAFQAESYPRLFRVSLQAVVRAKEKSIQPKFAAYSINCIKINTSRRDCMIIAQRFIAGDASVMKQF